MRSRTSKLQRFRIQKNVPYEKILLNLARRQEKEQQQQQQQNLADMKVEKEKRIGAE